MCLLLDDVVLGVQASHEEPLEEAAARSFLVVLARELTMHLIMAWRPYDTSCSVAAILINRR